MSRPPSTVRDEDGSTIRSDERRRAAEAGRRLTAIWERDGEVDLPAALEGAPELLADRSLFFDLAQREYRLHRSEWMARSPSEYCARFPTLDEGLRRSLRRLIEVEQCLGDVDLNELLDLPKEIDWPRGGERFGKFQVLRELGRGSAGRVYLCDQGSLDRLVVVKVSPAIQSEASTVGPLRHPNVVQVHDSDVEADRGLGWISMPYLGDKTLRDTIVEAFFDGSPSVDLLGNPLIAGRPLRRQEHFEKTALELFLGLARGLSYVHQNGILHGDLKSSNVLVTDDGVPMLIDFNLAQNEQAERGLVGGTLAYMAPEQLTALANRQQVPRNSVATDIFAFGMLMHEALFGEPRGEVAQFSGNLAEHAQLVLCKRDEWDRTSKRTPNRLDPPVRRLVDQCLAELPTDRPKDFVRVCESLEALCSSRHRGLRFLVRRPKACSAALASAVLIGMGLAWIGSHSRAVRTRWLASRHFEAGEFAESTSMLQAHLASAPEDLDARWLLANSLLDSGKSVEARDNFQQVYSERRQPLALAMAGYCCNRENKHLFAVAFYTECQKLGFANPAVEHNHAASLITSIYETYNKKVSRDIEKLLLQAYRLLPNDETVRLSMLRHHRICVTKGYASPNYPLQIASFPHREPSYEFCREAARMVVNNTSDVPTLRRLAIPSLQRIADLHGIDRVQSTVGSEALRRLESAVGVKIAQKERLTQQSKPPVYLDPRQYQNL